MRIFKKPKSQEISTSKTSKKDLKIGGAMIRFQIGLLCSLAFSYFLIETAFAVPNVSGAVVSSILEDENVYSMPVFEVEKVKTKEKNIDAPQKKRVADELKVVEDNAKLEAKDEFLNKTTGQEDLSLDEIEYVHPDKDLGPISVNSVEFVPVYPGCESLTSNKERRDCMSEQINRIVRNNFNASMASDYGLSGVLRIDVQCKIDKSGKVSDVKVRAPHKSLEKEAARVTGLIPQMKPGKQGNTAVDVIFLKPIIFKVE
ncbi:energy transducer TonB [Galbibacter sp. BG1]|uniref:energy transducer TonB n=1 Tax=Galbibacter sp. BG1 TaxID=1170699 RepID=UPI0015BDDB0F|nr:energy transducer TonB [Galbibacter sp. BG1]QLE01461.1 energy transducer TonB [Galbibacter sp. BG1]